MVNDRECEEFLEELLIAFPAFDDAARSSPDLAKTHRSWAEAWKDLSFQECVRSLRQLQLNGGITFEDYRAPGPFIRRLVMAERRNRPKSEEELAQERLERQDRMKRRKNYQGSPVGQLWAKIMRMKHEGASEQEIQQVMEGIG